MSGQTNREKAAWHERWTHCMTAISVVAPIKRSCSSLSLRSKRNGSVLLQSDARPERWWPFGDAGTASITTLMCVSTFEVDTLQGVFQVKALTTEPFVQLIGLELQGSPVVREATLVSGSQCGDSGNRSCCSCSCMEVARAAAAEACGNSCSRPGGGGSSGTWGKRLRHCSSQRAHQTGVRADAQVVPSGRSR